MSEHPMPDWSRPHAEASPKTLEEFKDEVKTKWEMDFDSIPKGTMEDLTRGPSLMAFDHYKIIGIGYPDQDPETGEETYSEFRVVDLSDAKE